MKKRVISLLCCLMLLCSAISTQAATTTKVIHNEKTKTYKKCIKSVTINGKKASLSKVPVFLKDGAYMGPLDEIFINRTDTASTSRKNKKTVTLTYRDKSLVLKENSKTATLKTKTNGKTTSKSYKLGSAPIYAKYASSKVFRWIVPINSVCTRLGITYSGKSGVIKITEKPKPAETTTEKKPTTTETKPETTTTEKKTETAKVVDPYVITIDAGHGGTDSGAVGNGYAEKNMTLKIVLAAKKYFDKDKRFKCYYTRTTDTYPSLTARSALANSKKSDFFLCVHINSAGSSSTGTETLYNPGRNTVTKNKRLNLTNTSLATIMHRHALKATGFTNRGLINRPNLSVLKKTNMPACLIEYGFISNKKEAQKMNANLEEYGKALYEGACDVIE